MPDGVLFLIPARGGSQRVPGKNLVAIGGIPLVGRGARTARLAAARLDGGPHRVICSTDDPAIAAAARAWGAETPFERPAALATAAAASVDVALHALEALGAAGERFRALVLVQPTSPMTEPEDLVRAVGRFDAAGGAGVVSVTTAHPAAWHHTPDAAGRLLPLANDGAETLLTGAFYVADPATLGRTRRFVEPGVTIGQLVPLDRSLDIDEPSDVAMAEGLVAARSTRAMSIGDRAIGGSSVFVIAEAGVNHEGDPALAHRLIDAAADTGADAVKFQTFQADALAASGAPTAPYQAAAGEVADDQRAMLARLALPADAWAGLQAHARERGIVFLSTPFDDASADLLDALDVPAFKVGSGELTNLPFLARLARRRRPMLVSTGMADLVEVAAAVDTIAAAGDPPLALFHCVSSYPARAEDADLRAIETMRRAFGLPTGWSDHTPGTELALAATVVGATLIEKHLTLDRTMPGPDQATSLEPDEFTRMVAGIRTVTSALGSGEKVPVEAERAIAAVARRSLHWATSLPAGATIGVDDLIALRPGTGLAPGLAAGLVGRAVRRATVAGSMVAPDDVEMAT
jgi:N-acetylneuraminate synthase/N,N'-diacetyllegionaminate synthase